MRDHDDIKRNLDSPTPIQDDASHNRPESSRKINQSGNPENNQDYPEDNTQEIRAVAVIEGCFPEKFGVPRQSGIAKTAQAIIRFLPPFNHENFLHGLALSSHIWLIFGFHQNKWNGKATVRPQRLGGNDRMGVFATRSSFRPNGLGLSAVKIEHIDFEACLITISGHDLVDGTPIYDIKPYIPFADSPQDARSEFAAECPEVYPVYFSESAQKSLDEMRYEKPNFKALIAEIVGQNPTPQFHDDYARIYGVALDQWDILFRKEYTEYIAHNNQEDSKGSEEKGALAYVQSSELKAPQKKLNGFTVTEIKVRS